MRLAQRLVLKYVRTKFKLLSSISKRKAAEKAFQLFCTPQIRNKKKLPPIFEKSEKLHFSFEENTIRGYRWNHPAEKKILILHGFESSVINFEQYVNPLIKKGYEVLAFDAPGHGRSGGKMINVLTYKNFIHYIYEHYGPVQSFISHSFGGLALSLLLEDIKHGSNFKIVLIAPAAETSTAIDNFFKFLQLNAGVRKEFETLINEIDGKPAKWYSIARAAKKIKARVLFLQDENDEQTPISDVTPIINENYPNFHFVISVGLGHRRIYRDNNSFNTIIDFL